MPCASATAPPPSIPSGFRHRCGSKGEQDSYTKPPTWEQKARLREKEQLDSCDFFGLSPARLRFHDSQQARNIEIRGHGFDQRTLRFNRKPAKELGLDAPCAETFQAEIFLADRLQLERHTRNP